MKYCFKCGAEIQPICGRCLCREAFQVLLQQMEKIKQLNEQLKKAA